MKQLNAVIASALVSGLLVLGMVGIGVNALTNSAGPANTVAAQVTTNSGSRLSEQFSEGRTRSTRVSTNNFAAPTQ